MLIDLTLYDSDEERERISSRALEAAEALMDYLGYEVIHDDAAARCCLAAKDPETDYDGRTHVHMICEVVIPINGRFELDDFITEESNAWSYMWNFLCKKFELERKDGWVFHSDLLLLRIPEEGSGKAFMRFYHDVQGEMQ